MSENPTRAPDGELKRPRGYLLLWIIGGTVVIGLLILVGVRYSILSSNTEAMLAAKINALKAAGEPVEPGDLAPPPIPSEQNAATYLEAAYEYIDSLNEKDRDLIARAGSARSLLKIDELKNIEDLFERFPRLLEKLEKAAACSGYDSHLRYEDGMDMDLSHLARIRNATRILAAHTHFLVGERRVDEAVRTGITSFQLARHLDREPLLVSFLVGIACRAIAVNSLNVALYSGSVSDETRAALDIELTLHGGLKVLTRAFRAERAMGISTIENVRGGLPDKASTVTQKIGIRTWGPALLIEDESYYIDVMTRQIAAAELPYSEHSKVAHTLNLEAEIEVKARRFRLTALLLPSLLRTRTSFERCNATLRSLRVLNALQRNAKANPGTAPKLADLGLPIEAITDPFTGKPLKVTGKPGRWTVYSIGDDGVDQGGLVDRRKASSTDNMDWGVGPLEAHLAEKKTGD